MNAQMGQNVVQDLRAALGGDRVPEQHQALGAQLLDHLSDAVRIVVLGRPSSGKSAVINMMLGVDVLGALPGVHVTEVVYGEAAQVTLEWPNGKSRDFAGHRPPAEEQEGAVKARVALPYEALKTQAFIEIAQPEDPNQQAALFAHAMDKGQVFVWCSEVFDAQEQAIWNAAPDAVKDHSFLVLTKADRQLMRGDLSEQMAALEDVAADEFLGLYPVAALHALTARSGERFQQDLWEASGGRGLMVAVQGQVRSGRAAELDRAAMLLAQLATESSADRSLGVTASDGTASAAAEEAPHAEVLERVQDRLVSFAKGMLANIDAGQTPDAKQVLSECAQAVRELVGLLEPEVAQEGVADILEDARDGEEMLMLLQVEQGPTAAEDAIFLMLQLKKEIGARAQP